MASVLVRRSYESSPAAPDGRPGWPKIGGACRAAVPRVCGIVKEMALSSAVAEMTADIPGACVVPCGSGLSADALSRREWLIGNGLGGFAMGSATGMPGRRYHGWLVGATNPPVGRVLALVGAAETLVLTPGAGGATGGGGGGRIDLSTFRFSSSTGGVLHPRGIDNLVKFESDPAGVARWEYSFGTLRVVREVVPVYGRNAVVVRYRVRAGGHRAKLEVLPLLALRDFHGPLLRGEEDVAARCRVHALAGGVRVGMGGDHDVTIRSWGGVFAESPGWWRNFELVREAERGLDAHEDFFTPGTLDLALPTFPAVSGDDLVHSTEWSAELHSTGTPLTAAATTADEAITARRARLGPMIRAARSKAAQGDAEVVGRLACAADAFVVRRGAEPASTQRSVIAGYPWFSDWGRDTLICLPGLLLSTGRHDEARAVLETFAAATKEGVVPNCFDDRTGEAMYNTADASLWYLHAACRYARAACGGSGPGLLPPKVLAACLSIVEWYQRGTMHGIRVDADGLLAAGAEGLALTWMDAKRDGVVFTPRMGKPVELQALWYSGLLELSDTLEGSDPGLARELRQVAYRCGDTLAREFWNPARGCLFDVLTPQGPDGSIRPNQIFAVSQPYSALSAEQQRCVVGVVRDRLLTPQGLRTLSSNDPGYHGRYRGPLFERDRAYHNGTVWPWLIGAYARAMRAVGRGDEGRAAALAVASLITKDGGLGSIAEIYEGEPLADGTRRADGCPAQAWSVAEALDALTGL